MSQRENKSIFPEGGQVKKLKCILHAGAAAKKWKK